MSFKRTPNTIPSPTPHDYDRQHDFSEHEAGNPTTPRPGAWLDTEFNEVERALDETQDRLALIQRDDGALQNESVGRDQMDRTAVAAIVAAGEDYLALSSEGFSLIGTGADFAIEDYAAGIEITRYNQVVRGISGEFWRASGSITLPYTTTGAGLPEGGAFVAVGDAVLRQELGGALASGKGANLVKGATSYVESIAEDISGLPVTDGQQISVTGWKGGSEKGHVVIVGRASEPKSGHNGVTVFSPTVPAVSAQTGATFEDRRNNYLAGAGETDAAGNGVFVLLNDNDLSVINAGASDDGSTVDTACFLAAKDLTPYAGGFSARGTFQIRDVLLKSENLYGPGVLTLAPGGAEILRLGRDQLMLGSSDWRYRKVSEFYFLGDSKASDGLAFDNAGTDDTFAGRWVIENCFFRNFNKAIKKEFGNIGNDFRNVSVGGCDFGYWALGLPSPTIMHTGTDSIVSGEFSGCAKAAIYVDSPTTGTGAFIIDGLVIEANPGFGIFIKSFASSVSPLTLRNVWFEGNCQGGPVTIDGVSYTPRDIYMKDTQYAEIKGSQIREVEFDNSSVIIDGCYLDTISNFTVSNGSHIRVVNANTDGLTRQNVTVESIASAKRVSGGNANSFRCVPRSNIVYSVPHGGAALFAESYSAATSYTFAGTSNITSTQVADGTLFDTSAEFVIPDGYTNVSSPFTITTGKWLAYTIDYKAVTSVDVSVNLSDATTLAQVFNQALSGTGKWETLGGVAEASVTNSVKLSFNNSTGASQTFRLGPVQVVEFDTEREAIEYFNSRAYVL